MGKSRSSLVVRTNESTRAFEPAMTGSLRHRLFNRAVRAGVQIGLRRQGTRAADINLLMEHLTDDFIDDAAEDHNISAPGDGSFFEWLLTHGPQLIELIKTIIQLLAMFR